MVKVNIDNKQTDKAIIITAIVCLSIVEVVAISQGFNGQLMRWMFVIIAGLAGLALPTPKLMRGN